MLSLRTSYRLPALMLALALTLGLCSCTSEPAPATSSVTKTDSMDASPPAVSLEDTIPVTPTPEGKKSPVVPPAQIMRADTVRTQAKINEGETIHKYTDGKTSVRITPWVDQKRMVEWFDRAGKLTYKMEEVRRSYSVSVRLTFHANGAVKRANIHENPGASRYSYETSIDFDEGNTPLTKRSSKVPPESLEDSMVFWTWDINRHEWVLKRE